MCLTRDDSDAGLIMAVPYSQVQNSLFSFFFFFLQYENTVALVEHKLK